MKCIGVLGGMSWESTALYYRLMNEETKAALGGLHSARIVMNSVDFHDIETLQHSDDWDGAGAILCEAAVGLKRAGADFLVIATNTMHKLADRIEKTANLPLLHIAEPTGAALVANSVKRVALLGTRFTMEEDFYRSYLERRFALDILVPEADDRAVIHRIIYEELCRGVVTEASRVVFAQCIGRLKRAGAEAVILGCTEITMVVDPSTSPLPAYDTTALHAKAAVGRALA